MEQIDDLQKEFWSYFAADAAPLQAQQRRLLTLPSSKGGLAITSAVAIAPIARVTALGEHARRLWEHEAPI